MLSCEERVNFVVQDITNRIAIISSQISVMEKFVKLENADDLRMSPEEYYLNHLKCELQWLELELKTATGTLLKKVS